VKCPKCGFVSFPGLDQCKKCGHHFTPVENPQPAVPPLFRQPSAGAAHSADPLSSQPEGKELDFPLEDRGLDPTLDPGKRSLGPPDPGDTEAEAAGPSAPLDWQKELAERMQEFRRRRARINTGKESDEEEPGLDFKPSVPHPDKTETQPNVIEFPNFDDLNLQEETPQISDPDLGALALDAPPEAIDLMDGESPDPEPYRSEPPAPAVPMEIEMESSAAPAGAVSGSANAATLQVAALSKRFFAGLFDLAVLLSAGAVFALIFWQAGGRLPLLPLNLAVAAVVGVIFLMAYFGGFMVFAHGTPGLIWAGLEVRTFAGLPPKRNDCLWRSFGYMVSVAALLLGFVWAVVDGEGLTWHDRMSRTLLVDSQERENLQAAAPASL
jgi:RDD family